MDFLSSLNYGPVTDRQTESDAYEPTVYMHRCAQKLHMLVSLMVGLYPYWHTIITILPKYNPAALTLFHLNRVTTKFPQQNSRMIQGYFKDLSMIFKDVKIRQKTLNSMVRY